MSGNRLRTPASYGTYSFARMNRPTHHRFGASFRCLLGIACVFCAALTGCGGGSGAGGAAPPSSVTSPTLPNTQMLSAADVSAIVQAAAAAAQSDTMTIAVVDRMGRILAVYGPSPSPQVTGNFGDMVPADELAVSLARTGAFFSNDEAPLSSRTVRFISGVHFPPGVMNAPNAALYGIENTNRGCTLSTNFIAGQSVPPARSIGGATTGLGVATGKADVNDSDPNAVNPGGVPLFRNGSVVGGIGVAGVTGDV